MKNLPLKIFSSFCIGCAVIAFALFASTGQSDSRTKEITQLNHERNRVEIRIMQILPYVEELETLRERRKEIYKEINQVINDSPPTRGASHLDSSPSLDRDKLQAVLDRYNSPLNAQEYIDHCSKYPLEFCRTFVGIMVHESRLCTAFHKPIEIEYHNCSGWKSMEILQTKRADANGSWLRKFDSYSEFYTVVLESFYNNYWQQGLTTPETISRKYVGRVSQNWINTVNLIKGQL